MSFLCDLVSKVSLWMILPDICPISKKTIYQYFKDKNDLVLQVTRAHLEEEKLEIETIKQQTSNAIETLIEESLCLRRNITDMNPSLLFDLRKYHQQAWDLYLDSKEKVYIKIPKRNFGERGFGGILSTRD